MAKQFNADGGPLGEWALPFSQLARFAQVAVGKTVDTYFKEEIGEVRNAASSVFERDETTNRIKWEDKVVNAKTGERKKVPVFRPNIPGTAILNLQSWLSATYNDLRSASGNIIQSLVRLSNSVVEINTIMNQCKAMLEATQTMVRPPAPVDDLDLIGKIFNEFASEAWQKLVPQPNGRKYPAYIVTLMSDAYGGTSDKPGHAMFKPGGEYHTKVLNSIKNAANPLARAEELYNKLVYHADRAHNPLQDVQIENNLDPAMKKFREDWPNARTPQEKDAVIKAFTYTFARSEAGLLQYMMLYGRETARTVLGSPKTFASAITDILFDEFDALSEGLDEKEEGKLKRDVYFVATGELGLGYWDALSEANILNALMNDAQKMGGDKDYKVDIGV